MRREYLYILLAMLLILSGCSVRKDSEKKLQDVEFNAVSKEDIPEELMAQIKEQEKKTFRITYGDKGDLYVARGYGQKETSGYSVQVTACFETENTICVETNLLGPPKGENIVEEATCPYVVIKMKYTDKDIVFK